MTFYQAYRAPTAHWGHLAASRGRPLATAGRRLARWRRPARVKRRLLGVLHGMGTESHQGVGKEAGVGRAAATGTWSHVGDRRHVCEGWGTRSLAVGKRTISLERKKASAPCGAELEYRPPAVTVRRQKCRRKRVCHLRTETPTSSKHCQCPTMASESPVHEEEPGLHGEMTHSRAETGKSKMSLEYLVT